MRTESECFLNNACLDIFEFPYKYNDLQNTSLANIYAFSDAGVFLAAGAVNYTSAQALNTSMLSRTPCKC